MQIKKQRKQKKNIKFSLVIPVAAWRKPEILESINKLDYDKKKIQILVEKDKNKQGPSVMRNQGMEKAEGDFIVILDDDAIIPFDYLIQVESFFNKYNFDVVGGPQLTPKNDSWFGKISGMALGSKFGGLKLSSRYKKDRLNLKADECSITSANLVMKKKVAKKIKFDLNLFPGEDPKFIEDCKKQGFKVAYSPNIYVYHKRRPGFFSLAKQIFSYGHTRLKKEKFIDVLKKPFFILPSLLVLYFVFLPFLYQIHWSFSLYGVVYLLITIFVSFFIAIRNKTFSGFFILPFILVTIHLSYGVGTIYGVLRNIFK